jgi:hypothetical protein
MRVDGWHGDEERPPTEAASLWQFKLVNRNLHGLCIALDGAPRICPDCFGRWQKPFGLANRDNIVTCGF